MATLVLNDHHQSIIVNFVRFFRYQRIQNLKSVEGSFNDVIESRLLEDTYTSEEVREMLTGLCQVICADVESELMISAHTKVLILKQLFSQAEKWHLNLQLDVSELQNREQLDAIKSLEDAAFNTAKSDITLVTQSIKLTPLADSTGPVNLLKQEINRLREENANLSTDCQKIKFQSEGYLNEIDSLTKKLDIEKQEIASLTENIQTLAATSQFDDVEKKLLDVQKMSESNLTLSISTQESLKSDLIATEKQLAAVSSQLQLAELELERKFSETAAYTNMLKMLGKKNEKIAYLRGIIKKYEPEEPSDIIEID